MYGVWEVVKRFLIWWLLGFLVLVFVSCIRHKAFIAAAFSQGAWAWINALMPIIMIVLAIIYMVRLAFK